MHLSTTIKRTFSIFILVAISSFTWATPIIFNFTGTINDSILSYGQYIKSPSTIPKWLGKGVSGSLILDLDLIHKSPQYTESTVYDSSDNNNFAQWMTFIINNPDGTSYTIPPAIDSLPDVDLNGARTYLRYRKEFNDTYFFAGRNYANSKNPPRQNISLRFGSAGEITRNVIDNIDFNTVTFHPELANIENYGQIEYIKDNGKKMSYYFTIDSLTRITSEVPEPGSWCLMVLGIAGVMLKRFGKRLTLRRLKDKLTF